MVNDSLVSSPSKYHAKKLMRPVRESLEHVVYGATGKHGYGYLNIVHQVFGMGMPKSVVRETMIPLKRVNEHEVEHIHGSAKALGFIKLFNKDAVEAPKSAYFIKLTATEVCHSGNRDVQPLGDSAKPVRDSLDLLDYETHGVDEAHPITFKMLVISTNKTFGEDFETFGAAVNHLIPVEKTGSSLDFFFNRNGQTLKQRTMPLFMTRNREFVCLDEQDGEPWDQYVKRGFPEDHVQKAMFSKQTSHKDLLTKFNAITTLTYTPTKGNNHAPHWRTLAQGSPLPAPGSCRSSFA